ncbi:hypothetical protein ACUMKS_003749 [Proteus mirabilis]|nr:hypothetical protein [Proteus mirabilis]MDN3789849.1 hypothetical protein [Proteus mirabilis]
MSENMLTVAKRFARGKKATFPIMTFKQLGIFLDVLKKERESLRS